MWNFPPKLKIKSALWYVDKENEVSMPQRHTHTPMFIAALFTRAKK